MINFNIETSGFVLKDRNKKKKLLKSIIEKHGFKQGEINYIFLDDEGLLKINIEYLNHNTYTDIITFDNSDSESIIEADIFISVERIKENAEKFKAPFEQELVRVLSHGILHLVGYKDKSPEDAVKMRTAEENAIQEYLSLS
jgi:probable rRNA maturation factor